MWTESQCLDSVACRRRSWPGAWNSRSVEAVRLRWYTFTIEVCRLCLAMHGFCPTRLACTRRAPAAKAAGAHRSIPHLLLHHLNLQTSQGHAQLIDGVRVWHSRAVPSPQPPRICCTNSANTTHAHICTCHNSAPCRCLAWHPALSSMH